jgi:flavin-dependent dehydrogenase
MVAGRICGKVAAGAAAADDVKKKQLLAYESEWRKELGANYRQGRFALELVRRMRDDELDRVALLFGERGLTLLLGKSTYGIALNVITTCLRKDPGALRMLGAFLRR